ncbi:conserved protein of unknown function [Magnetospirillum gryphiswaldense MSR-1 v2]|uniref:Bacteriophage-related protein n=1 Tax=Magnetospirillum gryphiswaldense (strain DSM 6361 / JCM 21280 / NBRC 15271 / MSR-1) TaxID=431944 RepID=V6F052_MAGGM|nr:hypothetical protein [Magnetospirillum gryphiswaldense]CDK97863.1 conserved protein of unknown function [Magnetospirillum gryphiswaldense MSR-1 v2]
MTTVFVPMTFPRIGGRKRIVLPDGSLYNPETRVPVDSPIVRSLARAFRWRRMLESGQHASINELAGAERVDRAFASRVLRLTLLAPDIVEAILAGRQPEKLTVRALLGPFPVNWTEQRRELGDGG